LVNCTGAPSWVFTQVPELGCARWIVLLAARRDETLFFVFTMEPIGGCDNRRCVQLAPVKIDFALISNRLELICQTVLLGIALFSAQVWLFFLDFNFGEFAISLLPEVVKPTLCGPAAPTDVCVVSFCYAFRRQILCIINGGWDLLAIATAAAPLQRVTRERVACAARRTGPLKMVARASVLAHFGFQRAMLRSFALESPEFARWMLRALLCTLLPGPREPIRRR
jgi:hypothetical protein